MMEGITAIVEEMLLRLSVPAALPCVRMFLACMGAAERTAPLRDIGATKFAEAFEVLEVLAYLIRMDGHMRGALLAFGPACCENQPCSLGSQCSIWSST